MTAAPGYPYLEVVAEDVDGLLAALRGFTRSKLAGDMVAVSVPRGANPRDLMSTVADQAAGFGASRVRIVWDENTVPGVADPDQAAPAADPLSPEGARA